MLGKIKKLVLNDVLIMFQVQDCRYHLAYYLILMTTHLADEKMEDQQIKQYAQSTPANKQKTRAMSQIVLPIKFFSLPSYISGKWRKKWEREEGGRERGG